MRLQRDERGQYEPLSILIWVIVLVVVVVVLFALLDHIH
jgi:uncharacterized membrane protein